MRRLRHAPQQKRRSLDSTSNEGEMAIPQLERARVERALDKFCDRVPPAIRNQLSYEYRFRGNQVLLIERRPEFHNPTSHTEHPFAKFGTVQRLGGGRSNGAIATFGGTLMRDSKMFLTFETSSARLNPTQQVYFSARNCLGRRL
jgi:hypothetical protein